MNVNMVVIAGNLTGDPKLKTVGQTTVASFGLAINDRYKASDGTTKETATFVDCEAWGKTADLVAQYLFKGSQALVEGSLKSDSWQTQAGEKRQKLMVKAHRVQFGAKRDAPPPAVKRPPEFAGAEANDDEPPF